MMNARPTSIPIFVSRVMGVLLETSGLRLFRDTQLCASGSRVFFEFRFGGGEGLFGDDPKDAGLLRRPKRLLNQSIFRRVEADDCDSSAACEPRRSLVEKGGEVFDFLVHRHAECHES